MARRATQSDQQKAAREEGRARFGRLLFGFLGTGSCSSLLVWYAVHHFDWAGPLVANSLRAVFGDDQRGQARRRRLRRRGSRQPPAEEERAAQGLLAGPEHCLGGSRSASARSSTTAPAPRPRPPPPSGEAFHPANPGPALKEWSAPGDGEWLGLHDVRHPAEPPRMYKTLLHPGQGSLMGRSVRGRDRPEAGELVSGARHARAATGFGRGSRLSARRENSGRSPERAARRVQRRLHDRARRLRHEARRRDDRQAEATRLRDRLLQGRFAAHRQLVRARQRRSRHGLVSTDARVHVGKRQAARRPAGGRGSRRSGARRSTARR